MPAPENKHPLPAATAKFNLPWHEVLAQVQDAIICANREGEVVYWNEAAHRLWGWSAEEMMGRSVFERLPPSAREWGRARFNAVLEGEESYGDRHDYRKDGSRIWIEVRSTPLRDASGQTIGIMTVGRDITERRQAEHALKLFRNLVDQSNDAFQIVDPATGRFLDVNECTCQDLGYSREELLSMRVQDIVPLMKEERWHQSIAEIRKEGVRTAESVHRRKDGTTFPVEINARWVTLERDYIVAVARDITERKQAEEALRRDAHIFSQLQESVICVNKEGIVTYWNEGAEKLLGWTSAEMQGQSVFERVPLGEPREIARKKFAEVMAGGLSQGDRLDYCKDGSRVWIDVRSTCSYDANGQPAGIISIARDITERKLAEEKLRHSEAMMAAAQRLAHFGSWELDLANENIDANPLRWSDECYRIFGFEPGSVKVTNELFFSRIPMEEHEPIRRAVTRAIAEQGLYCIEHRVVLPGGEVRFVQEQAKMVVDEQSGRPLKMVGTVHDITARRKVEEELRHSEEQFRSAMQFSAIGMALVALNGQWLEVNQAICDIVGYSKEELLATDFQSITHPDDLAADLAFVEQLVRGDRQTFQMEKRYIHKQGRQVWILLNVSLVRDDAGQPRYFISQIQDITERRQVMQELVAAKETAEAATRTKSEFLAMISHEIRTPLNPILGAVQLLMEEKSTPEQLELLRVIHNAGEHLLTLLTDLLDLAKMESGSDNLMQSPCRMGELIQGVFNIKHEDARRKQLTLKLELDPNQAFAYLINEPRMRQILLNLVGNAVKFTSKGQVAVRLERIDGDGRRDKLRFSVSDTGIGIAQTNLKHIFEPFYQVDSSLMRQHEGAGLGLAICQRLVETMGGEIGVESQLGAGSTFWFTLWLERRRTLDEMGTPWPMPLTSKHAQRILLASAEEDERLLLIAALEKAECEVTRASSGNDALALFSPDNFDLVLVDQQLPDLEWFRLVESIRRREAEAGATAASLILLTRNGGEVTRKLAQQAGVSSILIKPVRQVELLRMLARHAPVKSAGSGAANPSPSKPTLRPHI